MRKIVAVALLAAAAVLLFYGIQASDSFASSVKETFEGTPTDRSMWLILGGVVLGIIGLVGVLAPVSRSRA